MFQSRLLLSALSACAVLVAPALAPAQSPTDRFPRPIPMGVSIGTTPSLPFIFAGTAGLKVQLKANPARKFILSNNHVLGAKGPTLCPNTADSNTYATQPGDLELGFDPGVDPFYVVGKFAARAPMVTGGAANNVADAAIAFTSDALASSEIFNLGEPDTTPVAPAVGMQVTKSGRTTGTTTGTISTVNMTVSVSYGNGCPVYRFIRQVEIASSTFSSSGDSGSAILQASTLKPTALLFAGSPTSTVGNDINNVFAQLAVEPNGAALANAAQESNVKDPEQARLEAIQSGHEASFFQHSDVVGVGLSKDESGWFVKVHAKKLSAELQNAIPTSVEGVRVKVVESGEFRAY